jgi:zinc D-Ala-D-Ala carboxypeptidase
MKLSKNLSLAEGVRSETAKRLGIDNSPTKDHLENLKTIADKVFQPIRDHFKCPIHVSSMYRSENLNRALRYASATSLHMTGQAIDIDMDYTNVSNKEIFDYIKDNLEFDTLIWEMMNDNGTPKWVHVSYREGKNRNQILEAYKDDQTGLVKYKLYEPREEKKETKRHKSRSVPDRKDRDHK